MITGSLTRTAVRLVSFAAAAALVLAALGAAPAGAANPVVNPGGNFNATVTGGQIKIGSELEPIDVGTMSPAPRLKNVTIAADGTLSAAGADFTFPQIVLPVDTPVGTKDIFVQIRANEPVTGSVDPATGAISLDTALTIQLTSNDAIVALGNNCYVGNPGNAIPFHASAGPAKGVPYDEYTGQARLVEDTLAIPQATGCPTIVGQDVNEVVDDALGLPSLSGQNRVELALRFNPMPHSADWVDPEGPGSIEPVIVNDAGVDTGDGDVQRSWLESFAISDGADTARAGNTVRLSLLVEHNPGRRVTGLRIDDDWNSSEDSDGAAVKDVTAVQPAVAGGFNYSRVTYEYVAPRAGMELDCPTVGSGTSLRTTDISVRAVLDNGTETAPSSSRIRLSREDCGSRTDPPMIYGWQAPDPAAELHPGDQVTFRFRGDDTDTGLTEQNKYGGYHWRLRNLDTGATTTPVKVCRGDNQDNAVQELTTTAPERGRWVAEATLDNLDGDIFGNGSCTYTHAPRHWYWVGAIDVNSPQAKDGGHSPELTLNLPARPDPDGSLPISVQTRDTLDLASGGRVQSIEWDLDGDAGNGFETVRLGDARTGMGAGQDQMLLDPSGQEPGIRSVRVRVGDNGALSGADAIRRTTVAEGQYMVNTPPTAGDLAVETAFGTAVATPLSAADTNADGSHDPLSWSVATPPAHGFLSGEWPDRTYHPDQGFSGTDSFQYRVDDGHGGTATGTVTITVKAKPADPGPGPGDPPAPGGDALEVSFDEGRINLNEGGGPGTSGVKVVDSTVPDPPVVLKTEGWNRATGRIQASADDLAFPAKSVQMEITDPLPLSLDVKIEFGAVGGIAGSYDPASGAMKLDFDAHALITVTAEGLGEVLKCDVTPIPLAFSTAGPDLVDPGDGSRPAHDWKAAPFEPPAGGGPPEGAVTHLWDGLPASTAINEPLAPVATCGGTLDGLLGGKGGFWLGGKASFEGQGDPTPKPTPIAAPGPGTAVFDGKRLHIRLKCPARFRPACRTTAVPVTRKKRGKPMAKPIRRQVKSSRWAKVTFLIKPRFRAKVKRMSKRKAKQLFVRQKVRSKRLRAKRFRGKPKTVFHRYRVRSAG